MKAGAAGGNWGAVRSSNYGGRRGRFYRTPVVQATQFVLGRRGPEG